MNISKMPLKEQVKFVRQTLLLTQSQLAKETGISEQTIIRWENRKHVKPQMAQYGLFVAYCQSKGIIYNDLGGKNK